MNTQQQMELEKLENILIEHCGVTADELETARSKQRGANFTLGDILLKHKLINEKDLLLAFSILFHYQVVESLPTEISTNFTEQIPISFLKQHLIVPIEDGEKRYLAMNSPLISQAADDLLKLLTWSHTPVVLASRQQILMCINNSYDKNQSTADEVFQDIEEDDPELLFSQIEEVNNLLDDTSDSPIIRLVNLMFGQAIRDNASDIHIEPYQDSVKIRQRLDGVLYDMLTPPKHVQSALISRVKIMAKLNIAEKRLPQDGRIELTVGNREIDVRVSTLPTAFGERVVLRLLKKSSAMISLQTLGMDDVRLNSFNKLIRSPNGIVLVTGPTGSGKTTTLYAALSAINSSNINIITVEDPIEYRINGIGQVQINPKIGLTFASGLRSIVRQDPDVILVGEVRDGETADIAIQSALTGHLVFSTLHTNDAAGAITRLRDMGIEGFLIASSVNAILAQRLVRIICPHCREEYLPTKQMLEGIGASDSTYAGKPVFKGRGCEMCHNTGYHGRCGIFELLVMTPDMKELVLKTADANEIARHAIQNGMITLKNDGITKVFDGVTTIEEVYRVSL